MGISRAGVFRRARRRRPPPVAAILPQASPDPTGGRPRRFCRIGHGGLMPLSGLMRNTAPVPPLPKT
jgi:hypothetical protein